MLMGGEEDLRGMAGRLAGKWQSPPGRENHPVCPEED